MTEEPREDRRQQPKPRQQQLLKPATAAEKLGVFLPATPEDFRSTPTSRDALQALQADPPAWLVTLRREGPHPRSETARRLGVSNSALARAGVSDAMTTAEIHALLDDRPEWLITEREMHAPGSGRIPGTAVGERPGGVRAETQPQTPSDDEDDDEL
ncbi:DUF5997 family protein [Pseudolysinimonas sp.]|uniref:DUF5997 family protein n=1 Tax=Pseudolysinimonas sp. TaxID=2680009 RepID=UPI003F7FF006